MRLVKLTDLLGVPVWINPDQVAAVKPGRASHVTEVLLAVSRALPYGSELHVERVDGEPEHVVALLADVIDTTLGREWAEQPT